jgi:predicted DCC family thiol-disulfide oxidoreductase YuxK
VAGADRTLVLFDGICRLCCAAVDFLLKRDRKRRLVFAALQSEAARPPLLEAGLDPASLESIVVVEGGRVFRRSAALLRIMRALGGVWGLLRPLELVPSTLLDGVYDAVARRRYGWFGVRSSCRVPRPQERDRFL